MSQSKKAAKSAVLIIILGLMGKVLGFVREMLMGKKFGSGLETDTYLIALSAIALFTGLITRSINTTMIPVLSEVETKEGKAGKIEHTNNLLNLVILIACIISIAAFILAPYIIRLLAPGFQDEQYKLAILLMRIGIPAIILSSIRGVLRGYLQTEGIFIDTALGSFPINFLYISFLIAFSSAFGIKGLMVTYILTFIAEIFIQIYQIKKIGYSYSLNISFKDQYVIKMLYLIPPILISVGMNDLNAIIDKSMASTLIEGSISALNYSHHIYTIITSLFISAIITVLYPLLSKAVSEHSFDNFNDIIIKGINIILLITVPATLGLMILSTPIVKFVYERGAFDSTATIMTSGALVYSAMILVSTSINTFLDNVYYSTQDTKTPVKMAAVSIFINIIFNFILIGSMRHRGLALATTIGSVFKVIVYLYVLRRQIGPFGFSETIKCGLKTLISSLIMGVVVYFSYDYLKYILGAVNKMEFIALGTSILIGTLVYLFFIYIFKIDEFQWGINLLKDRFNNKD